MRYLQVTGIDGADLQLVDESGQHFALTVTDELRSSVKSLDHNAPDDDAPAGARPALRGVQDAPTARAVLPVPAIADIPVLPAGELVTPRAVQELLRAGHSAPQVAAAADWELAKVERYAAPIEAERSYIAGLVQDLPVGVASGESARTVGDRIGARLQDRGVSATSVQWDAYRRAGHGWVVVCRFSAGGRDREASWDFRAATRSLTAIDDEARWLGEDERGTTGPIPTPVRPVKVFDVEAEGGVTEAAEPTDLVSAMQARSRDRRARNKRASTTRHRDALAADAPDDGDDGDGDGQLPADGQDISAASDAPPTKPTVDELGHDPVTGTVDLFRAVPEVTESTGNPAEAGLDTPADARTQSSTAGPAPDPSTGDAAANGDPSTQARPSDSEHDEDPVEDDVAHGHDVELDGEQDGADSDAETDGDPDRAADADQDQDHDGNGATPAGVQAVADGPAETGERTTPPSRPGGSRTGRPSVPSWDDIMFGGRCGRD